MSLVPITLLGGKNYIVNFAGLMSSEIRVHYAGWTDNFWEPGATGY